MLFRLNINAVRKGDITPLCSETHGVRRRQVDWSQNLLTIHNLVDRCWRFPPNEQRGCSLLSTSESYHGGVVLSGGLERTSWSSELLQDPLSHAG